MEEKATSTPKSEPTPEEIEQRRLEQEKESAQYAETLYDLLDDYISAHAALHSHLERGPAYREAIMSIGR